MTWYIAFDRPLATTGGDENGSNLRQLIPVSAYSFGAPSTGTKIRVTYRAATSGNLNASSSYAGHGATSGPLGDFDGTQVQTRFAGAANLSVASTLDKTSDEVNYAFSKLKPFVISAQITFPGNVLREPDPNVLYIIKTNGLPGATTDPVWATPLAYVAYPRLEVWFDDPPGNPTCTIEKEAGQVDPTSGPTVKFKLQFNKGVTGLAPGDMNLTSSTVTWVGGAPSVSLSGSDFAYIVTITGMLTGGNVVLTVPGGVCTAIADGLPNGAATIIDNSVIWDPEIISPISPNIHEVCIVNRNMLRFEARDPPVQLGHYQELTVPDSDPDGTYPITNVVNNGYGQIRITTPYGTSIPNWFISNMAASPVSNGAGGFLIRCTMFNTALLGAGPDIAGVPIFHALGTTEANNGYWGPFWTIRIIDSTHFDILGYPDGAGGIIPGSSTFTNTYLGNGMVQYNFSSFVGESPCPAIHSVTGTVEANGGWPVMRSGPTTLDLLDSHYVNAWTGGGRVIWTAHWHQRPDPTKGGALNLAQINHRLGKAIRFQDRRAAYHEMLDREAILVPGNYTITGPGGLTVTKVYRKIKPYSSGKDGGFRAYSSPAVSFRIYIYLELSGNLTNGAYSILFPVATGLPPKSFTYNDKQTRCPAIKVNLGGHRPGDPGKFGYLGEWIPDYNVHGGMDYSAVTAWHLINESGTVVATFGAPALRGTPTSIEGLSIANPSGTAEPYAQTPFLNREGPPMKVSSVTKTANPLVTVDDSSLVSNGMLIGFSDMHHWPYAGKPATSYGHIGLWELETDIAGTNVFFRVINKSGNTFQIDSAKAVLTLPTIVSGGSGHAVGDIVRFNNGVNFKVASVGGGGAITSVTIYSNEQRDGWPPRVSPPYRVATGQIDYPYTIPSNPQAQIGSSGSGTGASFNLTWGSNYDDRTSLPGGFSFGNPDISGSVNNFETTVSLNRGNLCYRINELGNRTSTYVYGLDYGSFTTPGTYRIWLPNIGVSDDIVLSESRWWKAYRVYLIGCYHERSGAFFDGRFGYTRGVAMRDRPEQPVLKSLVPYAMSNYSLDKTSVTVEDDVFVGCGQGGGYSPYITTQHSPAYGSHGDAGDWDARLHETAYGYHGILDVWERLPSSARPAFYNTGIPSCLEAGMDPTVFATSDGLPDPIVEVIWGIEPQRAGQESFGGVPGGLNYGEGVQEGDNSSSTCKQIYVWAPDQMLCYDYIMVAAKLARLLIDLGYTTLASTYQASSLAAWNWAELMQSNTAARDAYYAPLKAATKWTTDQYNTGMSSLIDKSLSHRANAAASLFALTGSSTYKAICDGFYPVSIDVRLSAGYWEYGNAPGASTSIRDSVRNDYVNKAITAFVENFEATDIPYIIGQAKSIWAMNIGQGNDWGLNTQVLTRAAIVLDTPGQPLYDPVQATRVRRGMQIMMAHRHGANALGWAMPKGIGVRSNEEATHMDSRGTGQPLPIGIPSWGWAGNYPGLNVTLGDGAINKIQHPQWDPTQLIDDETIPRRELYPWDQLCWPRLEYLIENVDAIEHSEFTTQQQLLPGLAATMYLAGFDGNAVTGALETATVSLSSSINPSGPGISVIFTCNVSGAAGTPTGTVVFTSDAVIIGTVTLSGGIAQVTTSSLSEGSHSIVAAYGGNTVYDPNSSSLIQSVGAPPDNRIVGRLPLRMRLHA